MEAQVADPSVSDPYCKIKILEEVSTELRSDNQQSEKIIGAERKIDHYTRFAIPGH